MSARRGRPSGYTINPDAFHGFLAGRSQARIAASAKLSPSHLSEILAGTKGATEDVATRLTEAMNLPDVTPLRPGALFPELCVFKVEYRAFTVPAKAVA